MKNFLIFLSKLNIFCVFLAPAWAQISNVTAWDSDTGQTVSKIWKEDDQSINLRVHDLQLKQTQILEDIKNRLQNFENHFDFIHKILERNAESVKSVLTEFNAEEEPRLCIWNSKQKLLCSNVTFPTSCADSNSMNCWEDKCRIHNRLYGSKSFLINCVNRMEKSGWTTIHRRLNNSVDFNRNWMEYKSGFGNIEGNYWIGLEKLYALTATWAPVELLIILQDFEGITKYARYDAFAIGDERSKYFIKILGDYSGTAGNSLDNHEGIKFTTMDQDNDKMAGRNCAIRRGGWWYYDCFACNLNGRYFETSDGPVHGHHDGIHWNAFKGIDYSLKSAEMLIRPTLLYATGAIVERTEP